MSLKRKIEKTSRKIMRASLPLKRRIKLYWRSEALGLALSSPYVRTRDSISEQTAISFHNYLKNLSEKKKEEKITILKEGLDELSTALVDRFISRQDYIYRHNIFDQKNLFTKEEWGEQKICNDEATKLFKQLKAYKFKHYSVESFYGLSGLRWLPEDKQEKIKNGIFFDIGAFDGDSALAFSMNFKAKTVYAFEPEYYNHKRLTKNSKTLGDDIIKPIKFGVSDKSYKAKVTNKGAMSKISPDTGSQAISITSLDEYVKENNIKTIDVIKMDIEGEEQKAIAGASESIKRFKPVLAISIYHNAPDFFEIKPQLKELVPEYKFKIVKANPFSLNHELMLLAYV